MKWAGKKGDNVARSWPVRYTVIAGREVDCDDEEAYADFYCPARHFSRVPTGTCWSPNFLSALLRVTLGASVL